MKYINFHKYIAMVCLPATISTPIGNVSDPFCPLWVMHDTLLPMNIWSLGMTTTHFHIGIGPVIAGFLRPDFAWRVWRGRPDMWEQMILEKL